LPWGSHIVGTGTACHGRHADGWLCAEGNTNFI